MPNTQEEFTKNNISVQASRSRLREWISTRMFGGCRILSQGSYCICALCDFDRIVEKLANAEHTTTSIETDESNPY